MSIQPHELGVVSRLAVRLCELTLSTLPWKVPDPRNDYADWRIVAPALLGHATITTRTIMDLQPPQHLQAQILARSSMEAAILFAWLAASPKERVATWWEDSLARRSVTVEKRNDLLRRVRYAGDAAAAAALATQDWLPEDDALEQRLLKAGKAVREERRAGRRSALPPLEQQADQADQHWMGHMKRKGLGLPLNAFSVVYRTIYERGHDATHSRAGLVTALLFGDEAGQAYCGIPPRPPHPGELPYEAAGGAYIDMVCIAAEALGRPKWSQVVAVLQQQGTSPDERG